MKARAALMKTYNAPLEIGEIEIPEPTGEAVVVKIAGAGMCHSDLHLLRGELTGFPSPLPMVLGHENSGYVYAIGDKVPQALLGKPVLVFGAWYDEEDEYTIMGEQQFAYKAAWSGILKYYGGYAEYMYVPSYKFLVPAHGLDDLESAAILTDAGLTPYRAVKKLLGLVKPDDYVVVVGLGGLGLFGLQYVKLLLNAKTIAIDILDEKLSFAEKLVKLENTDVLLNASRVDVIGEINKITNGRGVRAVVDFVASRKSIETYMKVLSKMSYYVLVGLHSPLGPEMPIHPMVINEITFLGSLWGNISELYEVAEFARRKKIKYSELVEKVKLKEINRAFEKLEKGEALGRQVIVPK
ncbi:MAG: zinc-binding dehydrogenase [Sulfolobales archaeon]|nr:zinc-binding dehydrogenase [Sulfolobales archaeon]MCX8199389.1 zinc-binding dehydrogenase [Sulfolobales archaeon]MDW8170297.1 zinc-binding dehydrogenase [Desulfurococcaceae archaeon]